MSIYKTTEEREGWIKVAYSNHVIRPSLHVISKITGALFFIMLAATSGYLDHLYDNYPRITNILVAILAYKAADYLEDKVSRAIGNFAFAAVRWNQSKVNKAVAIGALIVMIPILAISAVTSFSGIQGNIDKGDLGLDQAKTTIAEIKSNGKNVASNQKSDLSKYKSEREEQRGKIDKNYEQAKKNIEKECKAAYSEKTDIYACINERRIDVDKAYQMKYDSFDLQTAKTMERKQELIDKAVSSSQSDNEKLIALLYGQLDNKNNQIQWVASIVGWGAMFFEAFALIAALLVHFICHECECDEEEMVKIGQSSEVHIGLFPAIWQGIKYFLWARR